MRKNVQHPGIGEIVRVYDLGIVDISGSVRGDCHCQVVTLNRLHLQTIGEIGAIVYMAMDEMIFLEIEEYIGRKCFEVDDGLVGDKARCPAV